MHILYRAIAQLSHCTTLQLYVSSYKLVSDSDGFFYLSGSEHGSFSKVFCGHARLNSAGSKFTTIYAFFLSILMVGRIHAF